jgi:hypothetical protein
MIRHVVVLTWSDEADEARAEDERGGAARPAGGRRGMTPSWSPDDAGLTEGNAHNVLIAEFPDVEAFRRYQQDPVHLAILAEHVRPWLAQRSSVQYQM